MGEVDIVVFADILHTHRPRFFFRFRLEFHYLISAATVKSYYNSRSYPGIHEIGRGRMMFILAMAVLMLISSV